MMNQNVEHTEAQGSNEDIYQRKGSAGEVNGKQVLIDAMSKYNQKMM